MNQKMDIKAINAMRAVALDAINLAQGGHVGMAFSAAPITYTLITKILNFDYQNPKFINRDRLILSAGHGSMSLYSCYFFMGLLSKEDLKAHKTWKSNTPSHPEIKSNNFIDASTGPLGQGVAMGVGMALSLMRNQKLFSDKNLNHKIFVICGDGDLQEGVALEAIQLAGSLKLKNLILIHDFNNVQIDSYASEVNNVNLIDYFKSQKFATFEVLDGENSSAIEAAILAAKKSDQPAYIKVHTTIAIHTENENNPRGHNGFFDPEKTQIIKTKLGFPTSLPFEYDQEIFDHFQKFLKQKKRSGKSEISANFFQKKFFLLVENLDLLKIKKNVNLKNNLATRDFFPLILNDLEIKKLMPYLGAGSADLAIATKIKWVVDKDQDLFNFKFGIREFAMASIINGFYLHSKIKIIGSTFLVFLDYLKAAIRLGNIMKIPSLYVFSHDSYFVGGDGPTHQPVEQITTLRTLPNHICIRPWNFEETLLAFYLGLTSKNESVSIISCRQPLSTLPLDDSYLVKKNMPFAWAVNKVSNFDLSILASGSEVELALKIADKLVDFKIQVISVPILQKFVNDKNLILRLLQSKPAFAIEASNDPTWFKIAKFVKFDGFFASIFGESAPGEIVYEKMGFSENNLIFKIKEFMAKKC